jgi:hypothetical protein
VVAKHPSPPHSASARSTAIKPSQRHRPLDPSDSVRLSRFAGFGRNFCSPGPASRNQTVQGLQACGRAANAGRSRWASAGFLCCRFGDHNSSGASLLVCNGRRLLVCNAAVLVGTGVAHCSSAMRAHECVLDTPSRLTTIPTCQSDCPTFNGSLAGPVTFRDDPHFAAELLGWHRAELYVTLEGPFPIVTRQLHVRAIRCKRFGI